jgi:hypothetical protein
MLQKHFALISKPLAPHGPNKNPHPDDGFGGNLMKENFKGLQHFNQEFA